MRQYVLQHRVAESRRGELGEHLAESPGFVVEATEYDVLYTELCEHDGCLHGIRRQGGVDHHRKSRMPSEQLTGLPQFEPTGGPGIQNDQIHGVLPYGDQQRTPVFDYREGVIPRESQIQLSGEWGREAGEDFHVG